MTEDEIRSEILLSLAELYEDSLTRTQFRRFVFGGADGERAGRVTAELRRQLAVEESAPGLIRLTEIGFKLFRDEIASLRGAGDKAAA